MRFSALELFAGAGGLALGLERAGFAPLALVDRDQRSCETLRLNRPRWPVICAELSTVDFRTYRGKVDLLSGGPPCQPFSAASSRYGGGGSDPRDGIPHYLRALRTTKPKAFLLENVPGLLEPRNRPYFDNLLRQLGADYAIAWEVLDASRYGVPQRRHRLVCVGVRRDLNVSPSLPTGTHRPVALRKVLAPSKLDRGWVRYPGGRGAPAYRGSINDLCLKAWSPPSRKDRKAVIRKGQDPNLPADTLKATQWKLGDRALCVCAAAPNGQIYVQPLGVRACAALQGFPSVWKFAGPKTSALRQIGNAVPPPFAETIARHMGHLLAYGHTKS